MALSLLASSPGDVPPAQAVEPSVFCRRLQKSCEDTCSFDFGTSFTLREKLGQCLLYCSDRGEMCLLRQVAKAEETGRPIYQPPPPAPYFPPPKGASPEEAESVYQSSGQSERKAPEPGQGSSQSSSSPSDSEKKVEQTERD